MIRLHEFVTKIRETRTIAEQKAQYVKEMAAIRQSFSKNQEIYRLRNLTKLIFINMSGQQTNFGQLECLKLITSDTVIEKLIGYFGLTQLFDENSDLLLMSINQIKVDLRHKNSHVVGITLSVLSEVCSKYLSQYLYSEVLYCLQSSSRYIKKKAILTLIKLMKKYPKCARQSLEKVSPCLSDQNHGVLLGTIAFLDNILQIDESCIEQLLKLTPQVAGAYRKIAHEYSSDYEIGGVQDPFLQVAILKFLRNLKNASSKLNLSLYAEVLVIAHDSVCTRVSGSNIKNGAKAVLFQCFQSFMTLPPSEQLSNMITNILSKFISVEDSNSKYLSLYILSLMTKYDISFPKKHQEIMIECLEQNDILIQRMALDLLYVISDSSNVTKVVKDLLNILLVATDEEFIEELSLKICLIVEKHSQNRRWHFDTILKVLILADQNVKEGSAKSLVHLVACTPELQSYTLCKLFFSAWENPQNATLCKVTLYLLGEYGHILPKVSQFQISKENVIDLIEQILFNPNSANETIHYGLSTTFKLFDKFPSCSERVLRICQSFRNHADLEVQKRACEYTKLLAPEWSSDRANEVSIPTPPMRSVTEIFSSIPVGDTSFTFSQESIKMPKKLSIKYEKMKEEELLIDDVKHQNKQKSKEPVKQVPKEKKVVSLLDDEAEEEQIKEEVSKQESKNDDPFGILGLSLENKSQEGGFSFETKNNSSIEKNLLSDDIIFSSAPTNPSPSHTFTGFENNEIKIEFKCEKLPSDTTNISIVLSSKSFSIITNMITQIAVLKYLKVTINPLSSSTIYPNKAIEQNIQVINTQRNQKPIVIKIKLTFQINGMTQVLEQKIDGFPEGF